MVEIPTKMQFTGYFLIGWRVPPISALSAHPSNSIASEIDIRNKAHVRLVSVGVLY